MQNDPHPGGSEAVAWNAPGTGMLLEDFARAAGVDLSEWIVLRTATAISPDGRWIIGNGFRNDFNSVHGSIYLLDIRGGWHPPVITMLNTPSGILPLNQPTQIGAIFTDDDVIDEHNAEIDWGDGHSSAGVVDEANHSISATHIYTQPGTHHLVLTLNDSGKNHVSVPADVRVNAPPVANSDLAVTAMNKLITFAASALVYNDTDPDGDALIVQSVDTVSSKGGSVGLANGTVTYSPPLNFNGSDDFTYIISDGRGGTANGTVTVSVSAPSFLSPNGITIQSGGNALVKFLGKARTTYVVQWSGHGKSWTDLGTTTAAVTGAFSLLDTSKAPGRSYRAYAP